MLKRRLLSNGALTFETLRHEVYTLRVLAGKPKLSPFLVNWENAVFIYSIFFISKQKYIQSHSSYKIKLIGKVP